MLIEINPNQFEEIYFIMETSFPQDERRPYAKQKALLDLSCYHIYARFDHSNMHIQAFLAIWDIPSLCFIEHFAVNPLYRNQGLGAHIDATTNETHLLRSRITGDRTCYSQNPFL